MPFGYQTYYIDKFPTFSEKKISTSNQLLLFDPDGTENKTEIHSSITETDHLIEGFKRYSIHHEHDRELHYRFYEKDFNRLIEINDFSAYYNDNQKLLIVQAPKELAHHSLKTFEKKKIILSHQKELNFSVIIARAKNVSANWFGSLPPGQVKTMAIFGDHVDLSIQYTELINSGAQLKYVILELQISEKVIKVGISNNRGITFYDNIDLVDQLTFVNNIHSWFEEPAH